MTKRVFAALACLAFLFTLLPSAVFAAGDLIEVDLDSSGSGAPVKYTSFETGWNDAVGAGNTENTTVKLLADWTATYNSSLSTTSFGTGDGFGSYPASYTNANKGRILVRSGKTITLDLNGRTINRNIFSSYSDRGDVIYVDGTLTVKDSGSGGKITGGNTGNYGGGVHVSAGTFTLESGSITGNKAYRIGGGVYVKSLGSFIMKGGSVSGNDCDTGAFSGAGGGVYVYGNDEGRPAFSFEGGTITNNWIGGALDTTNQVYVQGAQGVANNLCLKNGNGATVTVSAAPSAGSSVGVTVETPPTIGSPVNITGSNSADYSAYFTSDSADFGIRNNGADAAQVVQLTLPVMKVALDGSNYTDYYDFETGWNTAVGALNTADTTVKLLADWNTVSGSFGTGEGFGDGGVADVGRIRVPDDKTIALDLNGKSINRALTAAEANGECVTVYGSLTLTDNSTAAVANQGCIKGGYGTQGGGVSVIGGNDSAAAFTMNGGRITANKTSDNGAGVYLDGISATVFTMLGGEISGNECVGSGSGGGVWIVDGAFTVGGAAKVIGNTGGNVYLGGGKTVTVSATTPLTSGASIALPPRPRPRRSPPCR